MKKHHVLLALAAVVAALAAAGAASSSSNSSQRATASGAAGSGATLKLAFSFDPGSLDPDVFYDGEGSSVIEAVYEGLVQYAGNSSTRIEPLLAKSWTVSKDYKTFTFRLRSGVKFQDGTSMTSSTWKSEFQRRFAMNQGSAHLVTDVAKVETPNPLTLVLKMKRPVPRFLDYLASPYGIRAVSPKAVAAHQVHGDHGTGWLANHSAGTGPYTLANVAPGQAYELKAFSGYWGKKPGFSTIQFGMVPSFTTQELMLQSGQLDVVYHGISYRDLNRFKAPKFQVKQFPSIVRLTLWINPHVAPFTDPKVRAAVAMALDRASIVKQVYGNTADVANEIFTIGALPKGQGMFKPKYSPATLRALAKTLPTKKVDIAYTTDDSLNAQVAQFVQAQLSAAGLQVTTRGVTQQTTWSWPTKPNGRASMLILPANPDDSDPASFALTFYTHDGGLSYFAPDNVTKADQLLEQGRYAKSPKAAMSAFEKAAAAYLASGDFVPLADQHAVVVARAGICGWAHDFSTMWSLRLQSLRSC